MGHNKNSRVIPVSGKMDEVNFKQFERYGKIMGIGYSTLTSMGSYIILSVIKDVENESIETYNKSFEELFACFQKWPHKYTFKPINDLFQNPIIPKETRDEIMNMIIQQSMILKRKDKVEAE